MIWLTSSSDIVSQAKIGHPADPATHIGPIAHKGHFECILRDIEQANITMVQIWSMVAMLFSLMMPQTVFLLSQLYFASVLLKR